MQRDATGEQGREGALCAQVAVRIEQDVGGLLDVLALEGCLGLGLTLLRAHAWMVRLRERGRRKRVRANLRKPVCEMLPRHA